MGSSVRSSRSVTHPTRRTVLALAALGLVAAAPGAVSAAAPPEGQMIWGVHISLAPTCLTRPRRRG